MEAKSNYTLIGLAVIILLTGLLSTVLWLSVGFDRKEYNTYIVYMDETVSGLNEESPVKYNGVKVGFVSDIELSPTDPQRVQLILKIEDNVLITTSTRATLIAQGITGNTHVGLSAISPSLTPLVKQAEDPYPVIPYQPSFYHLLEKNIDHMSKQLNLILTPENAKHLNQTFKQLDEITATIAKNSKALNQSFRDLPILIDSLKISTKKFNTMAEDVSTAGNQFTLTMRTGKNSLDQLTQQTIPEVVLLLRRLNIIASNLENISNQARQNPAIILRGSSPPQPGPGERF